MGAFITPAATITGTESAPGIPILGAPTGGIYQSVLGGFGFAITKNTYVGIDTESITLGQSLLNPVEVAGSPFSTGVVNGGTAATACDPSGKFVYVCNQFHPTGDSLSGFSYDQITGILTPIAGSPFAVGVNPWDVTVDTSGKFVYVCNMNSNTISGFSYDPGTGALTPIAGSPFAITGASSPVALETDPTGKFLYVVCAGGGVYGFTYNSVTGVLTPIAGSPFAAGTSPQDISMGPSDKFLYVCSAENSGKVYGFSYDPGTGALTPIAGSPFAAGSVPINICIDSIEASYVYVNNAVSNDISAYSCNPITGFLTPIVGSPFQSGAPLGIGVSDMAIDPSGKFLYVTYWNGRPAVGGFFDSYIVPFEYDPNTGTLYPLAFLIDIPSASNGLPPLGMSISPNGRFIFSSDYGEDVFAYRSVRGYPLVTCTLDPLDGANGEVDITGGLYINGVFVNPAGSGAAWGSITGTITAQTDLINYIDAIPNDITINGVTVGAGAGNDPSNTVMGYGAFVDNVSGGGNVILGINAALGNNGNGNVIIGSGAWEVADTSSFNTVLGKSAGNSAIGNYCVFIGVGAGGSSTGDYKLVVDASNTGTLTPLIGGVFDNTGGAAGTLTLNAAVTVTGDGSLTLGHTGSLLGSAVFAGNTSGAVTVKAAAAAGTWSFTLPTSGGSAGQFLQTDGSGITSWQTVSGSGSVTTVSVVTANGISGSVANPTTTPAITLTLGAITPSSVAATGTVTGSNLSGTNTGDQTNITGNAGTATVLQTARNINGVSFNGSANITITVPISTGVTGLGTGIATFLATPSSANLAAAVTDETGSGLLVFATSPTLTTPVLGVATATTINKVTFTQPATGSTLTIADGKTLTASNSITLAGTDATTMTFPGASANVGYLEVPQNSQSANYTLVLADSGKSIDHPSTDANARTFTIPANSSVAYPVGTCISFSNMAAQNVTIAITTDTMYLVGAGTTGSRTLAQYGVATARKITSTTWLITGIGLT